MEDVLLYDPSCPNMYRTVKYQAYCRKRERERIQSSTGPSSIADALLLLAPSSTSISGFTAPVASPPALAHSLSMTAEELHHLRVERSASLGVQAALDAQKDALQVEHKRRKLEGTDARSRISSVLGSMMKMRSGDKETVIKESAAPPGAPIPSSSAPLIFKPSHMAAGGYVMDTVAVSQQAKSSRSMQGKPSSTLLLRFPDPPSLVEQLVRARQNGNCTAIQDVLVAPLLEEVRAVGGRHGVVRGVRYYVLDEAETQRVRERVVSEMRSTGDPIVAAHVDQRVRAEQLRVLTRFDTVAGAFKAAEAMQNFSPWCVRFFPTHLFDAGTLSAPDDETLCEELFVDDGARTE